MILDTRQVVHVRYPARFFSTQWTKNRKIVQKHKSLFTGNVGSTKDKCQPLISRIFFRNAVSSLEKNVVN